jgi:hypothetical protein
VNDRASSSFRPLIGKLVRRYRASRGPARKGFDTLARAVIEARAATLPVEAAEWIAAAWADFLLKTGRKPTPDARRVPRAPRSAC